MITQILTGFYNQLQTWETAASLSGVTFNTIAPPSASLPYITFGLLTETPMGDFGDFETIEDHTYYVNCFSSKSLADASSMADQVMDVLDGATISASGYTTMRCVREFIGSPIYDTEVGVYQIPLRFRVWLNKS